jgi:cysteine desulfurase / selenocysteine lyase
MRQNDVSLIYFDNAATSWPKPEAVYQAMEKFMRHAGASPGRSGHRLSIEAGRVVYEAREILAQLFNLDDPLRVVFTKNATEALNLAICGVLRPGDQVITSSMEHNSVMRPLRFMDEQGVILKVVNCSSTGVLDPRDLETAITARTRLIILNHASNVVGTLLPVAEIGAIARRHKVLFCVDAAQTAGAYPIDTKAMNIDLLAFTGHKSLFGPPGTGGLCVAKGAEDVLEPIMRGGTGSASESEYHPRFLPDKYESGTPNTVGLAGLTAGVAFVLTQGVANIRLREEKLTRLLIDGMQKIPRVTLYGCRDVRQRVAVVSFTIGGLSSSEVAMQLDEDYDIMCRPGLQCAPLAHKTLGTFPSGTVRLSPGYFTTEDNIHTTLDAIARIADAGDQGEQEDN